MKLMRLIIACSASFILGTMLGAWTGWPGVVMAGIFGGSVILAAGLVLLEQK